MPDCGNHADRARTTVPGIPDAELESVFEPFVQSSRTNDGSGGTGLGLTIARKIMSAHGGSIVAANASDGGTRVTLTLPAIGATALESDPPQWPEANDLLYASEVT